jgi:predicted porin
MKKGMHLAACSAWVCVAWSGIASAQETDQVAEPAIAGVSAYNQVNAAVSGDGMQLTGSSLQLYGLLSPTIVYLKSSGARNGNSSPPGATVFGSNGSFWGIRGAEDLGAGWQTIFQYENTVNIGTGTNTNASGNFAGRDTFLGVQSNSFGVLEAGLLTSPLYNSVGIYKFLGDQLPVASPTTLMTTLNGTSLSWNQRVERAVLYSTSKDSAGLVGHFLYTNDQSDTTLNINGSRVYTLSGSYGAGPLYLQYIYESRASQDKLAKGASNDWDHRIVGRYAFTESFAMAFGLDYTGSDGLYGKGATAGNGRVSRQAATLSLAKDFGRNRVIGAYAYARGIVCSGAAVGSSNGCIAGNQSSTAAQQGSLVYEYQLSKRTSLAAYVSCIWNKSQGLYDFDSTPIVQSTSARTPGTRSTGVGLGMLTTF